MTYDPAIPPEIRGAVEPILTRHLHQLPRWVLEVWVTFKTQSETGDLASMNTLPEYRRANLTLFPGFLTDNAREREDTIVHEFLHVHIQPMSSAFHALAEVCGASEDAKKLAREAWRVAMEGAVSDLAAILVAGDPATARLAPVVADPAPAAHPLPVS